jgi:5'-3' exonuclease
MHIILDGNNIAWAGYYALERAMKPDDDERKRRVALLGLASGILGAVARGAMPPNQPATRDIDRVTIAFDEGRPLRRRQVYPPYQTGRERDPKFIANEPIVLGAIQDFSRIAALALPVSIIRGVNVEADDLIAGVVNRNSASHARIVSTDRDFLQLISPTVSVYSPVKKLIIDQANFDECALPKTSRGTIVRFPRERFLDYRALCGDTSDDLPGVPGIGPLSAAALVARHPVDAYFGDAAAVRAALGRKSAVIERAFTDGSAEQIVQRNRTLMDLRLPAPCWDQLDALTTNGSWHRPRFETWLEEQRISNVERHVLFTRLDRIASLRGDL